MGVVTLSYSAQARPIGVSENETNQKNTEVIIVVTDGQNEPVIGAMVICDQNPAKSGIAGVDGKVVLSGLPEDATVTATMMGYGELTVAVGNRTAINITLEEEAMQIDDVVVVGYGTMKRSDLTGTVSTANLDKLQSTSNVNIMDALQGSVAGLNVSMATSAGSTASMSIRGTTTISGSSTPLIVLDGMIYRGNLVDINPSDIASFTVLKDASSAAIYGSEATNGVILVTTKTGKAESKPIIEYNATFSVSQIANKDMLPMDLDGWVNKIGNVYLTESRVQGGDMTTMNPDWDYLSKVTEPYTIEGLLNGTNVDWWDLLTNDVPYVQTHNFSVRGKSKNTGYYMSVGLTDQKNLVINDTYSRYNIRVNLDTDVTDWLKVGIQSYFTQSDYSGVSPTIARAYAITPANSPYDESGDLRQYPQNTYTNPLLEILADDLNKRNNLSANFYAEVQIPWVEGLSYRANYSQNLIETKHYQYDQTGYDFLGSAYKQNGSQYQWTLDNIVTYKRSFGEHDINATLLYGAEERTYESTTASAYSFTDATLSYNMLEAGQSDLQSTTSSAWREASVYAMARLAYTYNDKYMFTGTIRRDGFSGFGENNKFGVFPSAAVAWRISEEKFMDNAEWVNNLKLRLSYGVNGNRTAGRYETLSTVTTASSGYYTYLYGDGGTAENSQYISSMANADLQWETTTTLNIGVDFDILGGIFNGSFEYYTGNTKNLLYSISIPTLNGFSSIDSNIGEMGNTGQEFTLTARVFNRKDFSWNLTGTFSRNRNKVKTILGIDADGDGVEDDLTSSSIFIGEPYGVRYTYTITGMYQLEDYYAGTIPDGFTYGTYKIKDVDGDGSISAANDREITGYTAPSYRFNIASNMRYKDFDFNFTINSIQGGSKYYMASPSSMGNPANSVSPNSYDFDYWTPENTDARYRQLGDYNTVVGESFGPQVSRSFVRLQDLSIGYSVPQNLLDRIGISRLRVFLSGQNLLLFTDWDGWDPELGYGLTNSVNPTQKTYTLGLNIEF